MSGVIVELGALVMDRGAHLLVKRALASVDAGGRVQVQGTCRNLGVHLGAWCRAQGHGFDAGELVITRGDADIGRWRGAVRAGAARAGQDGSAVAENPPGTWGLAARGATVEAGAP